MKNDDLNNFFDFFTKETKEIEVNIDEVKEVAANPTTTSQKKPIMSVEEFDEFFKDIYKTLK